MTFEGLHYWKICAGEHQPQVTLVKNCKNRNIVILLWFSTCSLRKTLNQPSLVSNFDFLVINNPVVYERNLSKVLVNKVQKYLKLVLQKLGTLQFPSPSGFGFQVQKLIMTNLKVGKNFFPYPCLGFFHQNHPFMHLHC